MTLIRNTNTPEAIEFWRAIDEIAASMKQWPAWMKSGIVLNPVNFETYPPENSSMSNTASPPNEMVEVPKDLLTGIYAYLRGSLPTHKALGGHEDRKRLQKQVKTILESKKQDKATP